MRSVRVLLALHAAAVASGTAALAIGVSLPLAARRALAPAPLVAVVLAAAAASAVVGTVLLWRAVARPVDAMLAAARRLGQVGELPWLAEDGEAGLSRASVLFARLVRELEDERRRLAAKVAELTRADRALGDARDQLDRSDRLATMGRLAAGLAHEIGNPLGAVTGYAELARSRLPADAHPDLRDSIVRIAEASGRIDRILRELLEFARPAPARAGPVELAPVVASAVRLARVQSRLRRVEVAVELPPSLPAVLAEEHRLSQVLLNLLLNAGDAMEGAGRVRISAQIEPAAVVVDVADSGPGIAAEHLPRLFEPFFTTKAAGEGTGLGLATSHRIVQELGGALTAGGGPDGGAVFHIRLARAEPEAGSAAGPC
jgi:C4-dicarboxylate-specific signal transduction histidine kinase